MSANTNKTEKCPVCQRRLPKRSYKKDINERKLEFSDKTNNQIDDLFRFVNKSDVKPRSIDKLRFMVAIHGINEVAIRRGIQTYIDQKLYNYGYTIQYGAGMIKGIERRLKLKNKQEVDLIGNLPPEVSKGKARSK